MDIAAAMEETTVAQLVERGSLKWTLPPQGVLGAFVAESDLPIAPVVQQAVRDALDRGLTGYLPGYLERQVAAACAAFQQQRFGWGLAADAVHTLPDVLTAMAFTATHLATDGPIVVPTPAYMPFLDQPGLLGRRLVTLEMDRVDGRYRIDPERLARALDGGGLLVLVNPHNPTGQVATRAELEDVARVVQQTGSTVFADEIHSPLVYPGGTHLPYASLTAQTAAHTVTAVSASKGWNLPGLACAQIILTNPEHRRIWDATPLPARHGTSPLGAVAAVAAYSEQGVAHLNDSVAYLDRGRQAFTQALTRDAPGIGYRAPQATYIHWLDLHGIGVPAGEVARRARVQGTDGAACGTPGFLRLTLATPVHIVAEIAQRIASLAD